MAIDFARVVYEPTYAVFGREVTFTPLASQPNAPAYLGRGIYATEPIDVVAEDGSIFSDQRTILDILELEFSVVPIQGDKVEIPVSGPIPAEGGFYVIEAKNNGGGETTLTLRKIVETKP